MIPAPVGVEVSADKLLLDPRVLVESRREAIRATRAADIAQTAE